MKTEKIPALLAGMDFGQLTMTLSDIRMALVGLEPLMINRLDLDNH